ncbi:hypothetical protein ACH50O_21945 [Methylomonas sp. 2BW1-5-20]|uniref:hypothetical protein n=1 Tax=Methylomonas sp. 2BW1-5-20 TaxID=3376686 RepID=UPI0040519C94
MKTSYLTSLWDTPDNSRLTAKQFSLRLPVHVSAKIAALCEMYPNKTRTQIIGDLLTSALEELEKSLPTKADFEPVERDPDGQLIFEDIGLRSRFRRLSNSYYQALEKEIGNEDAPPLFELPLYISEDGISFK